MNDGIAGRKQNKEAFCPSCERFIGPVDECPYCYADSARNPLLRSIRYGALVLAVAGLFFLHLMSSHSDVPLVKVSEITPMMNFALVRISGVVVKEAYVGNKKGRVDTASFTVDDGSGQIRVAAYSTLARELVEGKHLPGARAKVDVVGSLNVSAGGNLRLILRSAGDIRGQ